MSDTRKKRMSTLDSLAAAGKGGLPRPRARRTGRFGLPGMRWTAITSGNWIRI